MTDPTANIHEYDIQLQEKTHTKYRLGNVLEKSILDMNHADWLVVNEDSIFAYSLENKKVYLFNLEDKLIDSFPISHQNIKEDYVCYSSSIGSIMAHSGNNLVVPATDFTIYDSRYSKEKILNSTSYSNPYDKFAICGDDIFFSSEEDHKIYKYNITTKQYSQFNAKSNYIDNIEILPDSCAFNRTATIDYSIREARYLDIYYDKYSNRYYRIAKHKTEIPESKGLYKAEKPKSNFSFMIFDSELNLLDEIIFDEQVNGHILPTINGLVLQNRNGMLYKNRQICLDLCELIQL